MTAGCMAARAHTLETGLLVEKVVRRIELHLALARYAQQPVSAVDGDMIMRQTTGRHDVQCVERYMNKIAYSTMQCW